MSTFVYYQLYVFLATFYAGIVIGLMYDIYKIYRNGLRAKKIIAAIQDILFWIIISIVVIYVLVYSNDGKVRGYSLIGFIIGALTYNLLLSKIVVRTIKMFLNTIKKIMCSIYRKIVKILSFFYKIIMYPFKKIYKFIKPLLLALKRILNIPKKLAHRIKEYSKKVLNKK